MFEQLKVGTWACVDDQCPIRPVLHTEDNAITLVFGEPEGFELFVSAAALQTLIRVRGTALEQLAMHPNSLLLDDADHEEGSHDC
ncbi:hypothetical protein [Nocardia sp. NPDC059228]|uniref:hypothetical protein n=1 Tax=Nocardia sp. NPDC059228 TaxID=3346777 RepID=UPI0036C10D59